MTFWVTRVALKFALSLILLFNSPLFAAPGDERWDIRFSLPGTDNSLLSMTVKGTDLYAGGDFSLAGPRNVNHVAKWDGTNWSNLGTGIANATNFSYVYALAFKGNDLYAGGIFTNVGNILANGIAKWDGTNWSALPGDFSGYALGFAVSGNDLYVAGVFTLGTDTNIYAFAKFDGASWNTFGSTISGCIGSFCTAAGWPILLDGSDIYVGGSFTTFAGLPANSIVRWDGVQWNPLSSGVSGTNVWVQSIVKYGGQIIAGGGFTSAGGIAATNLARWDGANWFPLGNPNNTLQHLFSDGTSLYVGGSFTQIGGVAATRIARWDGANWFALGAGLNGTPYSMVRNAAGELLVSGQFGRAGNVGVANIARWDGNNWSTLATNLGNGMNRALGFVRAFDVSGTDVYASGIFTSAGDALANRAAKWNGDSWSALGTGITGPGTPQVRAIAHIGTDVYFGGTFTNAGSVTLSNIAKWTGSTWTALAGSVNSNVNALAVSGGELYVGGSFTLAGGVPVNRVAKWTGSGWLTLGSGMNSNVTALVTAPNGDVYAGGSFTNAGGTTANRVAKWNNASGWTAVGNGINSGTVSSLAISGTNLYVGGSFSLADGLPATNVARWNGLAWSGLGTGLKLNSASAAVTALAARGNELFAGGSFTNAGGLEVSAIARWDGTNWYSVGSGLTTQPGTPTVSALALDATSLWVGGNFSRAGGRPSANIGRWLLNPPVIQLTGTSLHSGGHFHFTATGLRGLRFRIDSSSGLPQWNPLLTGDGFADSYEYTTTASSTQFFRVAAE